LEAKVIGLGGVSFVGGLDWRRSLGFLIGLSVRTVFLRVEATAGTSVPITFGGDFSYQMCLYVVFGLFCRLCSFGLKDSDQIKPVIQKW